MPDFRDSRIDVFVGGSADGRHTAISGEPPAVTIAVVPPQYMAQNLDELDELKQVRFTTEAYIPMTFGTRSDAVVSQVRFWCIQGMTPEQALLRLCLGYNPKPPDDPQPTGRRATALPIH